MNVVVNECDLNFQGQTFQMAILTIKCWKNTSITEIRYGVRYLPSIGATVNVLRSDLNLHFQGHEF